MSNNVNSYNEEQIRVLEGLEAVRMRPDMYIGSTDKKGLHHLVWEIVDNSVDEAAAGFGDKIDVTIHKDNSITVTDNGRGIPVGMHSSGKPTLEVVLTVLHAGGKFGGDSAYKTSGGLHGVGSACTNALSERMIATVKRGGEIHQIEFEKGVTTKKIHVIGTCDENETGTSIWFKPDPLIFTEGTEYDYQTIFNRLREFSHLNGKLMFTLTDERVLDDDNKPHYIEFYNENGLKGFITHLNKKRKPILDEIFHFEDTIDDIYAEVAFQFTSSYDEYLVSFANNIKTSEGGTHVTGFRTAITQVIKQIITDQKLIKNGNKPLESDDIRTGLVTVISVKVPEPKFHGQTKNKLQNPEVRSVVQKIVQENFAKYLNDNPRTVKPILDKILEAYHERVRIEETRNAVRKQAKKERGSFTLPEKLADCRRTTPLELKELFIVEGDSAGGSAKGARESEFQAVLPLRGKILNTEKASFNKMIKSEVIGELVSAIGTGIGENFDYEARRYDKIVIMTDADVDGAHIQVLLLTFFFRFMRPLIENGHIYMAQPPLYGLKRGNKLLQFVNDDKELKEAKKKYPNAMIQRYKGLGEMNKEQLWETTMNPEQRTLIRINFEDAHLVDELLDTFMGKEVEGRKRFIEENSHRADLDI